MYYFRLLSFMAVMVAVLNVYGHVVTCVKFTLVSSIGKRVSRYQGKAAQLRRDQEQIRGAVW